MSNRFRAAALVLREYISDTYSLLAAADAVVSLIETEAAAVEPFIITSPDGHAIYNWATRLWDYDHGYLVDVCRRSSTILQHLAATKKINAIKELRSVVPGTSLISCKKAVEDSLVVAAAELYSNPWDHYEDEAPF